MRKRLAKVVFLVLAIALISIPTFVYNSNVKAVTNANTLAELRKELETYKKKKKEADASKGQTQGEINASKNDIMVKQAEIETNQNKIEEAKAQSAQLEIEISDSEERIKELLKAHEISRGDNYFLEYVFGAKSISDFIIRYSISEQITSYNDTLIDQHEAKIEENTQLQKDLKIREEQLDKQIADLQVKIESLGSKMNTFVEEALDAQKDIDSTQQLINEYVKMGCGENEPFSSCVKMQSDTGFLRPLKKGVRTSDFGYRTHPVTGVKNKFHSGVDIGGNSEGTSVYSVANGMVGKIINRSSCGGNQVYIYHTVNGVKYTSTYMHLKEIKVKVGDYVTNQSVIGTVGGGASTKSYDKCSTGAHLHLSLAKGWYGSTYVSYSTWVSNLLDAGQAKYSNIPPKGKYFYSRSW